MSHDCLYQIQSTKYQAIYTIHYIGLSWIVIQWILDGIQIGGWILQVRHKNDVEQENSNINEISEKRTCYMVIWSPYSITYAYPAAILFINFWVTLTWAVFYKDWSTSSDGSLTLLAWRVILAGLSALLGALLLFHRAKILQCILNLLLVAPAN